MPQEFRFLVFSAQEAAKALTTYARDKGKPLPAGAITTAEPVGDKTIAGRLTVETEPGKPVMVPFNADETLEALIAFCLGQRIPLPMVSEKVLEKLHGRFALRIGQIDSMDLMMRMHAPRTSR